jgi:hypothetical protein
MEARGPSLCRRDHCSHGFFLGRGVHRLDIWQLSHGRSEPAGAALGDSLVSTHMPAHDAQRIDAAAFLDHLGTPARGWRLMITPMEIVQCREN